MLFNVALIATYTLLSNSANAHPGDDHHSELMKRAEWLDQVERRDLSHCSERLKARGLHAKSLQRRRELADHLRAKRALDSGAPPNRILSH